MTETASELLSAIRDATDDGRIEWILDDDGKKLHAILPGTVSDYAAVMCRNDKFTMEIHDTFGKVIDKIEPSIMQDRSTISYIHSYAMNATYQSKAIFQEIIECLTNK